MTLVNNDIIKLISINGVSIDRLKNCYKHNIFISIMVVLYLVCAENVARKLKIH